MCCGGCWLQLRQSRLCSPDGALAETASVAPPPPWQHPHRQPRGLAAAGNMIEVSTKIREHSIQSGPLTGVSPFEKLLTSAFTLKNLLKHYAKQVLKQGEST